MKRTMVPVLLAGSPYLSVCLVWTMVLKEQPLTLQTLRHMILLYLMVTLMTCLPSGIFLFFTKEKLSLSYLAFWDMVIKLAYVPFYLGVVLLSLVLTVGLLLFGGPVLGLCLLTLAYAPLLVSSLYGWICLKEVEKRQIFSENVIRKYRSGHFFFCVDVVYAIILYRKIKKMERQDGPVYT